MAWIKWMLKEGKLKVWNGLIVRIKQQMFYKKQSGCENNKRVNVSKKGESIRMIFTFKFFIFRLKGIKRKIEIFSIVREK